MTMLDDTQPAVFHPIGRNGQVTIKLASADLRLTGTDGDHVVVRTPGGRALPDRVAVETTEAGLTIREREAFGVFGMGGKTVRLEIELPATADLTVDTASGEIESSGLRGEQRYRTASGDSRIRGAAGRIELNTVSGDAELELAAAADLTLRTVSGDVAVSGGELTGLRISTTSGDIRVDSPIRGKRGNQIDTLSGDVSLVAEDGMRVEARTVSGDLTSDLPHKSEGRMGRRTLVVGDGSVELSFRSVSGDLQVHDARRRAGAPTAPIAPAPPASPAAPVPPMPPAAPQPPAGPARNADEPSGTPGSATDAARLDVLRALEAGELDVATAMDQLAALDAADEEGSDA